ncbi:MAG: glycosyltransferase family 2 protein [Phycisphaeraceae bacterium]|nr:glycosyltransferase family 2 protein [Phycisphaeraceae bacterium]
MPHPPETAAPAVADPSKGGVCVVIPCFNHGRFVADAVISCLAQIQEESQGGEGGTGGCPLADMRVVIVDDGSNDGSTPALCDRCIDLPGARGRLEVVHQANAGLPAARNAGAAHPLAREAEFLVFLDADDWVEPTFVARLRRAMTEADAEPGGAPVSHAYCQERLVELGTGIWRVPGWDPVLLMVTNLHPVTTLVRRACFDEVRGFDESMRDGYEDWDLWLRFASRGWRGVRVREPLFVWRRHSPVTMIVESGKKHGALFARLVANHREFYLRHADEVMVQSNVLLRRSEANWLDESLEAIPIRDLRAWKDDLIRERNQAWNDVARLTGEVQAAAAQVEALRVHYEAKPAVRFSRSVYGVMDRLPRVVSAPFRALLHAAKRLVP